jgi:simple sugar transport system ATP-binding protein
MQIPSFTVAENVVLGHEPTKNVVLDQNKSVEITQELSKQYGLFVEPEAITETINVGMRQRIEILKILYLGVELLILDEPTAVLTPQETKDLFKAIRVLVKQGKTIIFITHKLREVKEISDRVTVMRNGKVTGTLDTSDATRENLARMMVGREVFLDIHKKAIKRGQKVMSVKDLFYISETGRMVLRDVSFNLFSGEILGIAGVEGNGQTELVEVLSGLRKPTSGKAVIAEEEITGRSPREVRMAGVAHIPEDRLSNGLALEASIEDNLIVDRFSSPPFKKGVIIDDAEVEKNSSKLIKEFNILAMNGKLPVSSLSGGNMQKVVIAREFSSSPKILIAAQPTRGIDVGATEFIREQLIAKRTDGAAILLVSADLSEVMSLSDRIITMFEGEVTGVFPDTENLDEEELGYYMLGVKRQPMEEMEELL